MIKTFNTGLLGSNVHIFYDESTKEAMIVDCGVPLPHVHSFVKDTELKIKYIVLTHGHYDHVHFIGDYANEFPNADIICHKNELKVLHDSEANVSELVGEPTVYDQKLVTVSEGDTVTVGSYVFKILNTPGHTPGCICLYCEKEKLMFTGDVLFDGAIGRTDFKYGSMTDMRASLLRLLSMDGEISFYSGHYGPSKFKYQI